MKRAMVFLLPMSVALRIGGKQFFQFLKIVLPEVGL